MPTEMSGENKAQATKSRRSVQNMNPAALQKKRESDRNAQRNIREKAKNEKLALEQKVKILESQQDAELKIQLAELERQLVRWKEKVNKLTELCLQNGINPEPALSPTQEHPLEMISSEKQSLGMAHWLNGEGMLEGIGMDRPTTVYQNQQYSPTNQQTFPLSLCQQRQQPSPLGLAPIQYPMESPHRLESHSGSPPQLVGSPPQSIERSHPTASHTSSPEINESPVFTGVPQSMASTLQRMRDSQGMSFSEPMAFSQHMPIQSMGPIQHMGQSHPMSTSQSMGPLHQNPGFQHAYPNHLAENWEFVPQNTQMWDNGSTTSYSTALESMTMAQSLSSH